MRQLTIGVAGRARSGKGSVARMIQTYMYSLLPPLKSVMVQQKQIQIVSLADPFKDFLTQLVGSDLPFRGNERDRNTPLDIPWSFFKEDVIQAVCAIRGKMNNAYGTVYVVVGMTPEQRMAELVEMVGPNITGRELMQTFGTDVIRKHFSEHTWLQMTQMRANAFGYVTVVDDVRFKSEAKTFDQGGIFDLLFKVERPGTPVLNHQSEHDLDDIPNEHYTSVFYNTGTLKELTDQVEAALGPLLKGWSGRLVAAQKT